MLHIRLKLSGQIQHGKRIESGFASENDLQRIQGYRTVSNWWVDLLNITTNRYFKVPRVKVTRACIHFAGRMTVNLVRADCICLID